MIDSNDGGVDISTQRRRDLVRAAAADLASSTTSSVDNRVPVPRDRARCRTSARRRARATACRRPASRSATGTPSAAARPATPCPTRPTRTSSTPASTAASSRATTTAPARPATSASTRTTRPGHGADDPALPLPVDRADPGLAARPEGRLPRRQRAVPHRGRRADLDGDQPRPDAQRQDEAAMVRRADHRRQHRRRVLLHDLRRSPSRRARRACSGPAATTGWSTSRATAARAGRTSRRTCRACPSGARSALIEPSPFDAGTRLRRRRRPPPGRRAAVPLEDDATTARPGRASAAALPQDVYLHAVREDPKQQGPALRRHRARRRVSRPTTAQTWKQLQAEPADRRGARPRRQGRRPGRRHARPLDLDPRRPDAAARVVEGDRGEGRAPLQRARPRCAGSSRARSRRTARDPARTRRRAPIVYYWLKDEPKDDADGWRCSTTRARSSARSAAGRSSRRCPRTIPTRRSREPKPLPKEAGLQRAVWDLRYEGAPRIHGAKIDSGEPGEGPAGAAGALHAAARRGRADAHDARRGAARPARERATAPISRSSSPSRSTLRDDIDPARRRVEGLRSVREQVKARTAPLRGQTEREPLVEAADALAAKCDALEARLHNPKAEVAYDILAQRGGASSTRGSRRSTAGRAKATGRPPRACARSTRRSAASSTRCSREWKAIVDGDVAELNEGPRARAGVRDVAVAASRRPAGRRRPSPGRGARAPRAARASARRRRRRVGAPAPPPRGCSSRSSPRPGPAGCARARCARS